MFVKRVFLIIFLIGLIVSILFTIFKIFSQKTSAQVTSGSTFIGDINIDSGGGRRDSGSVAIVNSSIGDTFGGVFVSGSTLVGAGHVFKKDTVDIAIDKLVITTGQTGVNQGRYGLSGRTATDIGNNNFNDILVNPKLTAVPTDVQLVGAAFTENIPTITTFQDLTASADLSDGFVIVYANQPVTKQYYNRTRSSLLSKSFVAGNFYVFYKGTWSDELQFNETYGSQSQGMRFVVAPLSINTDATRATSPNVYVYMYQTTPTTTWQTYVLGTGFGVADQIVQKDPVSN